MRLFPPKPRADLISILFMTMFVPLSAYGDEALEFYIKTVHVDGKTNIHGDPSHKPEPFPGAKLPEGGGLVLTGPDAKGA